MEEMEDSDDIEFVELEHKNIDEIGKPNKPYSKIGISKSLGHSMSNKLISDRISASRRKAIHKVIDTSDEILFESYPELTNNQNSMGRKIKKMPRLKSAGMSNKIHKKNMSTKHTFSKSKNKTIFPCMEYMKKIAFFRACINYILESVGKNNINFGETNVTLSKLVKQNTILPSDDEVIDISD